MSYESPTFDRLKWQSFAACRHAISSTTAIELPSQPVNANHHKIKNLLSTQGWYAFLIVRIWLFLLSS
jgi:hypothetical protein